MCAAGDDDCLTLGQVKFECEYVHDIWAMGVTFYVMLTGSFPWKRAAFDDKDFAAFLRRDYTRGPWSRFTPELREVCGAA